MAERRMLAKEIITSDQFIDMQPKSQLLYFQLAMEADDDGFINNAWSAQRLLGIDEAALQELMDGCMMMLEENRQKKTVH